MTDALGFIYAIQCGDAVKIGFARDPLRRLSELNVGYPGKHRMIGFSEGDRTDERRIHASFAAERIRGEWFRLTDRVTAFLGQLTPYLPKKRAVPAAGKFETFCQIIEIIGHTRLAGILGTTESHVRVMKARNSIPLEKWTALLEGWPFPENSLTEIDLYNLRCRRFTPSRLASTQEGGAK